MDKHTQWTAHRLQEEEARDGNQERGREDGWTQGLALRAAMMMYPFSLCYAGGRVGRGPVGRLFLGVVGWGISQIHFHIIRHFFQEVRGNQTTMAVDLTLWTETWGEEDRTGGANIVGSKAAKYHTTTTMFYRCVKLHSTGCSKWLCPNKKNLSFIYV